MFRGSALLLIALGLILLARSVRWASPWLLAAGLLLPAFGAWLLTRSLARPKTGRATSRFSVARILFGLAAPIILATAALPLVLDALGPFPKRFETAMKSDLRNIAHGQRSYRDSVGRYASLPELRAAGFKNSTGVYTAMTADSIAWRASALHEHLDRECTIWAGRRPQDARFAGSEEEPACRKL